MSSPYQILLKKTFFSVRITELWNNLVDFSSLERFRRHSKKVVGETGIILVL